MNSTVHVHTAGYAEKWNQRGEAIKMLFDCNLLLIISLLTISKMEGYVHITVAEFISDFPHWGLLFVNCLVSRM